MSKQKCLVDSVDAVIKNAIFSLSFVSNTLNFIQELLKYCEVIFGLSISVGFTIPVIGIYNVDTLENTWFSAALPLELDTNLSILKVSNLNYLERRVQTLGGSCLHLQLLGICKYGSPVLHTRER